MPPEAKVFIVDPSLYWQDNYDRLLIGSGHTVVAKTENVLKVAAEVFDSKEKGLEINVVITEGNIGFSSQGEDGIMAIGTLRRALPDVKIVGITKGNKGVYGADLNLDKNNLTSEELVNAITEL